MQRIHNCYILFLGDDVKKKELFEQNALLHNRLGTVNSELKKYKQLYIKNTSEIEALRKELEELITKHTELLKTLEERASVNAEESITHDSAAPVTKVLDIKLEDMDFYGAEIIGKIVLEGTKISNSFAENQSDLSIDVINLILGKTEVCKAKIYDICHSDIFDEQKKATIDSLYSECMDYFASLSGQIQ